MEIEDEQACKSSLVYDDDDGVALTRAEAALTRLFSLSYASSFSSSPQENKGLLGPLLDEPQ